MENLLKSTRIRSNQLPGIYDFARVLLFNPEVFHPGLANWGLLRGVSRVIVCAGFLFIKEGNHKKEGSKKMKEHKNYNSGVSCEFSDGKKRGGRILKDLGNSYLIGYYGIKYREIIIPKSKVNYI